MLLRIEPDSARPRHTQLADQVREHIRSGAIAPGQRLPTARDVADSVEVNVHTVLRAYQTLRDEGLIELRRGRGAVVLGPSAAHRGVQAAVEALIQAAARAGLARADTLRLVEEAWR